MVGPGNNGEKLEIQRNTTAGATMMTWESFRTINAPSHIAQTLPGVSMMSVL
jgi:hypothetical protein